ncbi:MAG: hypothetical protein F6K18_28910 [Okeania sp. SIO2C2]|uniref:hypothetical protein n=1 Tax=Okeania sp. SIO2C2 TaxID=2607787 RepID=UPI0013BA98DE|nr:hypothetical protein [Okeania sp. SIO2C2]NEP90515.1 hypothetical protein [Okeania sp. SIO2C2]
MTLKTPTNIDNTIENILQFIKFTSIISIYNLKINLIAITFNLQRSQQKFRELKR